MNFNSNHEKFSKNQIHHFSRLVQILEKKAVMINFDYIRTYSMIKKKISSIDSSDIQQLNQLQQNQHSQQSFRRSSQLMTPKGSMLQAIQELKIKNITEQINQSQYETSNTKQGFRKIIELERRARNIKANLKDNKIILKSNEEKFYEICLAVVLIFFIFTFTYTIIHELKN
ncbi:unnamed protein product [Paramecium pentaurelia]|uniref:Transmembrane protein n=1 Tax=Paramecium pentaurelia TaxID=43138 RepID=A0A8S1VXU4_9CILI|nr:unnamed protein product [Paramecium pentaurelia]